MNNNLSWVVIESNSDFSIENLPFGIFSYKNRGKRVGVAVGNQIIDLVELSKLGYLKELGILPKTYKEDNLNVLISYGKDKTNALRKLLKKHLTNMRFKKEHRSKVTLNQADAIMHLPIKIGDYTDFYSSIEHATNVGKMFRDPKNALLPNWRHLPVGYHGRSSSIVVSGTQIKRPYGQTIAAGHKKPTYGPSERLDFELEMGFVIGKESNLGEPIAVKNAEEYIFGLVLFNDWSARDIQKWEYVPLGPFLGKSFASSMSPWVVPLEALDYFRRKGPTQRPAVLPYLRNSGNNNYDINLEVGIEPENGSETIISHSNFKYMYWNMAQQLAHHTVNGCNVKIGDLMASGTISGKSKSSYGSLLELSWSGKNTIELNNGSERTFLEDHDTVIMRGYCRKKGIRVGFGEVKGQIIP